MTEFGKETIVAEPDKRESLRRRWREMATLQASAAQFRGRLRRTAPVVAELATQYPELRDAVSAVETLTVQVSRVQEILGGTTPPDELLEMVT